MEGRFRRASLHGTAAHYRAATVEDTLAGDIFQRHVILGAKDASRAGCNLDGLMGHIWKNDVEVAPRAQPAATSEDLVDIVRHVANTLPASGEKLAADT